MNKTKTPRSNVYHYTEDEQKTLCGRKIYSYWSEPEKYDVLCDECKELINGITEEVKEIEKDVKDTDTKSSTSRILGRKGKMATW